MLLAKTDAQLFLGTVQAFVGALPPSPKREPDAAQTCQPQSEDWNQTKRHNAITFLRFEVWELTEVLTEDRAICDLSGDAFDSASDALEELLDLLDGLVDDGIPRNVVRSKSFIKSTASENTIQGFQWLLCSGLLLRSMVQ